MVEFVCSDGMDVDDFEKVTNIEFDLLVKYKDSGDL